MLPPGVGQVDFDRALESFAAVVGKEWVFVSDEDVVLYRDPYSPLLNAPGELVTSAAVAPSTVGTPMFAQAVMFPGMGARIALRTRRCHVSDAKFFSTFSSDSFGSTLLKIIHI